MFHFLYLKKHTEPAGRISQQAGEGVRDLKILGVTETPSDDREHGIPTVPEVLPALLPAAGLSLAAHVAGRA